MRNYCSKSWASDSSKNSDLLSDLSKMQSFLKNYVAKNPDENPSEKIIFMNFGGCLWRRENMAREFEIGDIVEIGSENQLAEVVGVIHDVERLFVWFPDIKKEQEFPFAAVVKQWREVTAR